MIEATLLVVLNNMDGERWYTSTNQLEETLLQICEAVRRMPGGFINSGAATLHRCISFWKYVSFWQYVAFNDTSYPSELYFAF